MNQVAISAARVFAYLGDPAQRRDALTTALTTEHPFGVRDAIWKGLNALPDAELVECADVVFARDYVWLSKHLLRLLDVRGVLSTTHILQAGWVACARAVAYGSVSLMRLVAQAIVGTSHPQVLAPSSKAKANLYCVLVGRRGLDWAWRTALLQGLDLYLCSPTVLMPKAFRALVTDISQDRLLTAYLVSHCRSPHLLVAASRVPSANIGAEASVHVLALRAAFAVRDSHPLASRYGSDALTLLDLFLVTPSLLGSEPVTELGVLREALSMLVLDGDPTRLLRWQSSRYRGVTSAPSQEQPLRRLPPLPADLTAVTDLRLIDTWASLSIEHPDEISREVRRRSASARYDWMWDDIAAELLASGLLSYETFSQELPHVTDASLLYTIIETWSARADNDNQLLDLLAHSTLHVGVFPTSKGFVDVERLHELGPRLLAQFWACKDQADKASLLRGLAKFAAHCDGVAVTDLPAALLVTSGRLPARLSYAIGVEFASHAQTVPAFYQTIGQFATEFTGSIGELIEVVHGVHYQNPPTPPLPELS